MRYWSCMPNLMWPTKWKERHQSMAQPRLVHLLARGMGGCCGREKGEWRESVVGGELQDRLSLPPTGTQHCLAQSSHEIIICWSNGGRDGKGEQIFYVHRHWHVSKPPAMQEDTHRGGFGQTWVHLDSAMIREWLWPSYLASLSFFGCITTLCRIGRISDPGWAWHLFDGQ